MLLILDKSCFISSLSTRNLYLWLLLLLCSAQSLSVRARECPTYTNNHLYTSCFSHSPETVPPRPQLKLPQHGNNAQETHCLELPHQLEKRQYSLSHRFMRQALCLVPHTLLLSKHIGAPKVELFPSICQGTETGVREVMQTVQGHISLRVNLECE